jgi:lysophospholipase L1-like esterase
VVVFGGLAALATVDALDHFVPYRLQMRIAMEAPDAIQVFWDTGGDFNETGSVWLERPGSTNPELATTDLPQVVRALRIDPGARPTVIQIDEIKVSHLFVVARWDASNGFAGWTPAHHIVGFAVDEARLSFETSGNDPYLVNSLAGVRIREGLHTERIRVGVGAAIAGALLAWLLTGSGTTKATRTAAISLLPRSGRSLALKLAVFGVTALVVGGVLLLGAKLLQPTTSVYYAGADDQYELSFVDRSGRRVSKHEGPLQLVLDPFTFFNNYPNQRTPSFWIDEHGFRGGIADEGKPSVFVLGGSSAFGYGLASDAQMFSAILDAQTPHATFVNASVTGFVSGQELAQMVHHVDQFRPTAYIVFDGFNDFVEKRYGGERLGVNSEFFVFVERLRSYYLLTEANGLAAWQPPAAATPKAGEDALQTDLLAANLEKMAAWAAARGAAFQVVLQPEIGAKRHLSDAERAIYVDPGMSDAYQEFATETCEFLAANEIACHNMNQAEAFIGNRETLFLDAIHLNALGHAAVAEVLEPLITGLLGTRGGPAR